MEDKPSSAAPLTLRRFLRLYAQYAKMDLAWFLRDTKFCLVAIASDWLANIASISGIFLLALRFENFGGMNSAEVLFMLSYLVTMNGIYEMFLMGGNVGHISRRIGRGQMDHMFLQPLPLTAQLLTEGFLPFSGNSSLITGLLLLRYAIPRLGIAVTPWWWLALLGNLLLSVTTVIGLSFLFSTTAFYAPVACEEISSTVFDVVAALKNFPLDQMPAPLQVGLLSLLPTGILGWFPCLVLLGRPPLDLPGWYPLLFCALLWLVTAILFRKGLRHYVRIGINRYSSLGHRS